MNHIEATKRAALWRDEINRRAEIIRAIDYYNYRQVEYLEELISKRYPNENEDIQRYKFTCPLTKSLIDQLAVVFKDAPDIVIDGTDAVQEAFIQLLDDADIYKRLKTIDRYAELCHKVGAMPRWDGEAVVIDLLTPDRVMVITDPANPTKPVEVSYCIGHDAQVGQIAPIDRWVQWTDIERKEVRINNDGVVIETLITEPNPYKTIPVVWFSVYDTTDTFWLDAGFPLVELNETVNVQLTNLDIALDFQSFSTMVTIGLRDSDVIPVGVTRRINIPQNAAGIADGDVKYVTPDAKLETVWKIIQERIQWFAGQMGISVESISGGAEFSSGFQLKLAKQGVIDHNIDKKDSYRESVRDLCQLLMDCSRIYGKVNFPENAGITVNFADVTVETDPLQQRQIWTADKALGIADEVTIMMKANPDMTEELAIKAVAAIKARRTPVINLQTDIGI